MSKFTLGVPVKTRLPVKVWLLAAGVTVFSLVSSALHVQTAAPNQSMFAGFVSDRELPRGS
jgi:hypothetical protein